MYGALGEEDVLAGLWKRRCRTEYTRAGMMLSQVGLLPAAQDIFLEACRKPMPAELSALCSRHPAPIISHSCVQGPVTTTSTGCQLW